MNKGLKNIVLPVLFFSAIWGLSEAFLGGYLYRNGFQHASIPLTVIALVNLTVAKRYLSFAGSATLVAVFAMLYKFLNLPFFACHLLGIILLGISYDIFFSLVKAKNSSLKAALTCIVAHVAFAFLITYVFRYEYWVTGSMKKIAEYVFISGGLSAVLSAIAVPLTIRMMSTKEFGIKGKWILPQTISYACWFFAIGMFIKAIM